MSGYHASSAERDAVRRVIVSAVDEQCRRSQSRLASSVIVQLNQLMRVLAAPVLRDFRRAVVNPLAVILIKHYERTSALSSLELAIDLLRVIIEPEDYTEAATWLSAALIHAADHSAQPASTIDEAIQRGRDVIAGEGDARLRRNGQLVLASALLHRFSFTGRRSDLDEAIAVARPGPDESAEMMTAGHLDVLAASLWTRGEAFASLPDIDEAVDLHQAATRATPRPGRPLALTKLALALRNRFEILHDEQDLEDAVRVARTAAREAALFPDDIDQLARVTTNLSVILMASARSGKAPENVLEAVQLSRDALDLLSGGSPKRAMYLGHLIQGLLLHEELASDGDHLDECIALSREMLSLSSGRALDNQMSVYLLAIALQKKFALDQSSQLGDEAEQLLGSILAGGEGNLFYRLSTARFLARLGQLRAKPNVIGSAYDAVLSDLRTLPWMTTDERSQLAIVRSVSGLARDAAAIALETGDGEAALRYLENARTVQWRERVNFRVAIDRLKVARPSIAARLERLAVLLVAADRHDAVLQLDDLVPPGESDTSVAAKLEQAGDGQTSGIGTVPDREDEDIVTRTSTAQVQMDSFLARFRLGLMSEEEDDLSAAAGHYLAALDSPSASVRGMAAIYLGSILNKQGDYERARDYLRMAASSGLRSIRAQGGFDLGLLEFAAGRRDEGVSAYSVAIDADAEPYSVRAAVNLANEYCMAGDYENSLQMARRALAFDDPLQAVMAKLTIANVYAKTDRLDESLAQAEECVREVQQLPPSPEVDDLSFKSKFNLAGYYRNCGRAADSIALYRQLSEDPQSRLQLIAAYFLGVLLTETGEPDEAECVFRMLSECPEKDLAASARQHLESRQAQPEQD